MVSELKSCATTNDSCGNSSGNMSNSGRQQLRQSLRGRKSISPSQLSQLKRNDHANCSMVGFVRNWSALSRHSNNKQDGWLTLIIDNLVTYVVRHPHDNPATNPPTEADFRNQHISSQVHKHPACRENLLSRRLLRCHI